MRTEDDFKHDRTIIDAAHQQNETQRDSFIALAHTALFAASISFVGSVTPLKTAIWRPVLVMGWSSSVAGLLALTFSFGAARREIDRRRAALNDETPPSPSRFLSILHHIATWTFPFSLLCLFSFVTANVVSADEPSTKPAVPAQPPVAAVPPQRGGLPGSSRPDAGACPAAAAAAQPVAPVDGGAGHLATATRTQSHRAWRPRPGRRHARAAGAHPDAAPASATAATGEEVTPQERPRRRCY